MDELEPCLLHKVLIKAVEAEKVPDSVAIDGRKNIDDATIIAMRIYARSGHTMTQVAKKFGYATSTIRRHVHDVVTVKDVRNKPDPKKIQRIKELRAEGWIIADVCKELRCSSQTVLKYQ
jgi:AraC-like DNA-binding protein